MQIYQFFHNNASLPDTKNEQVVSGSEINWYLG